MFKVSQCNACGQGFDEDYNPQVQKGTCRTKFRLEEMSKVKECQACGQGFDEDNQPKGSALPLIRCLDGNHEGPIVRIQIAPAVIDDFQRISSGEMRLCAYFNVSWTATHNTTPFHSQHSSM